MVCTAAGSRWRATLSSGRPDQSARCPGPSCSASFCCSARRWCSRYRTRSRRARATRGELSTVSSARPSTSLLVVSRRSPLEGLTDIIGDGAVLVEDLAGVVGDRFGARGVDDIDRPPSPAPARPHTTLVTAERDPLGCALRHESLHSWWMARAIVE